MEADNACSLAGVGANSDHTTLLEFIDAGNDVLIAVDSSPSEAMRYNESLQTAEAYSQQHATPADMHVFFSRTFAADIGFDLDARGATVTDHISYVKSATADHTLVASEEFVQSSAILGNFSDRAPILFKGAAATMSPESTLVRIITHALMIEEHLHVLFC